MSEQAKDEKGKVKKLFDANLKKLTAVLGGESLFRVPKADGPTTMLAIAELVKEEKEQLTKELIAEARNMIREKRDFDKFVKQQQQELNKKVEEKQKQFNEKCKALWGKIADITNIEKDYYSTLNRMRRMIARKRNKL
jgi:hypothetical protein